MTYINQTYIQDSDGVIVGVFCGPFPSPATGYEQVPDGIMPRCGDLRAYWDSNWNPLPTSTLVEEGVIPCPFGFQLQNGALVELTLAQQIASGQVTVPTGQIFDQTMNSGAGGIRPMTIIEEGMANQISLPVLQSALCAMVDSWQGTLLDKGFPVTGMSSANGTFSADPSLLSLATTVLTAASLGEAWPTGGEAWPDGDDNTVMVLTLADFKILYSAMTAYTKTVAMNIGTIKAQIRAATDCPTATTLFTNWEAQQ